MLFATSGGEGKPAGSTLTASQVKEIREREGRSAAAYWGATVEFLDLGDTQLAFLPLQNVVYPILEVIRRRKPTIIFTFHPEEHTQFFQHIDHNIVGTATGIAADFMNVAGFFPNLPATTDRSRLAYWTSNPHLATHVVHRSQEELSRRDAYLIEHYPSQFQAETQPQWRKYFDTIDHVSTGTPSTYLAKIR